MTAALSEHAPSVMRPAGVERRLIDRGAIFAGYVGLGMALVIAIAFELIIPVQPFVFLAAPIAGALIGAYANVRSERWRPRLRVLANAAYAGLVTSAGLVVLYVTLRLVFVYADSGALPDRSSLDCSPGPACVYQRYLAARGADELAAAGITDAASFEAAVLREQAFGALVLVVLTSGSAILAGAARALRPLPNS